jgi:uncharacterized protein (DUF433 family)
MEGNFINEKIKQIYGGDPREFPLYGLAETSRYLKINIKTLSSWVRGRNYKLDDGTVKFWSPVIKLPDPDKPLLSFYNLVEVHVLSGIRRIYNIQFRKVRDTLEYLEEQARKEQSKTSKHPLATQDFWTDEFDLFIKSPVGNYICTSRHGQQVIKEVVDQYLHRIERDNLDLSPFRLYPFVSEIKVNTENSTNSLRDLEAQPKNIVIDPLISFGRPTLAGTGIPTNVIAGRFSAGEKIDTLAKDYDIEETQIQEALSYEGITRKAA